MGLASCQTHHLLISISLEIYQIHPCLAYALFNSITVGQKYFIITSQRYFYLDKSEIFSTLTRQGYLILIRKRLFIQVRQIYFANTSRETSCVIKKEEKDNLPLGSIFCSLFFNGRYILKSYFLESIIDLRLN